MPSDFHIRQWQDNLPEPAVDLFGHEVNDPPADATPVAIAAVTDDGDWAGGVYMLIESPAAVTSADGGRVASIRQLVIPPAFRGRGLAGRLLRRAEEIAREHGCTAMRSTAGFGCGDHLSLYRRLGFNPAPPAESPYLVRRPLPVEA